MPGIAAYAASKAGLDRPRPRRSPPNSGRRASASTRILPGGTDTPRHHHAPSATPEVLAFVDGLHALKRMASPEEIAQSALYLASDASSFTTGTAMLVDGGVSINRT